MENDDLLSPKKAAQLYGITTQTLRNWDKNGRIKSIRTIGGQRRFKVADLDAIFKDNVSPINISKLKQKKER